MQLIREVRRINEDRIEIAVPKEFREKELEILIFPLESEREKVWPKKKIHLTTFKCFGKKANFSRDDAYANEF